ncbi:hypothetical protein [Limnohabitans sp. 2KL-3]|uniref:hypothetical protein n=1 Tax=Limnohabitans sp. 2KL-3 TaxID=1100700 RepID=UPI000AABF8F1|nr:hypothetical protein [Limnohabitans sp. 2KL-3]
MATIARALPEILQLVDHALAHSKQLQVNDDGGVQLASFGTKVLRALNGIGQSDDWKLQQQQKVASAVRQAIEKSLDHSGSDAVANKYDRLFSKVREINLTAQAGELPVQRYAEALRKFDHVDTLSLEHAALPTGATAQAMALAGTQDYRPLQDVRASLAAELMVDHELKQLDPKLAATLGNWLDSYRQEAQTLTVAADPEQRAAQGAQLLARLVVLSNAVDQAVHQTSPSDNATAALDRLGERISGEIHLMGAVIANKSDLNNIPDLSWRQAVELRRLGIDLQAGVLFDGQLQGQSVKHLAGGAFNQVFTVSDLQGKQYVYKPGRAHSEELDAEVLKLAMKKGADVLSPRNINGTTHGSDRPERDRGQGRVSDMRFEARNVAASRLDTLLDTHVIVGSQLAMLPKNLLPVRVIDEQEQEQEQRTADETFSNFGLLMDKASGKEARDVSQSAAYALAHRDPAFLRDLSNMQLVDCILCSLDRHSGNFLIDISPEGRYQGLKGIDNDFSLSDGEFEVALFEEMTDADMDLLEGLNHNQAMNKDLDAHRFSNATAMFHGILDRQITELGHDLTDDMKSRIQDISNHFYNDFHANNLSLRNAEEEVLVMTKNLREDIRSTGLPDTHPLAHFFDRCLQMQQELADISKQREALFAHMKALGQEPNFMGIQPVHNLGLPGVADLRTATLLLSPDFEGRMVESFRNVLTPAEVKSAVQRLQTVQAHLRHLESEGRLLNDTQWRMDHVDAQGHTVGEILSDARHNHIARLDSKFEQWQAKEAANAVHPTPTPESIA